MPANLILEIGCEEIPSRYLPSAVEQLKEITGRVLGENRVKYAQVGSWATPRRLVLYVEEVAGRQEDLTEKIKGPPVDKAFDENGEPTQAALGFARSSGVEVDDLVREHVNRAEYLWAFREIPGKDTEELLPRLVPEIIDSLRFPRSMYWEKGGTRFARPIRWLLCVYGKAEVKFEYAGVASGRHTYGHRVLSEGSYEVPHADDYFDIMREGFVVLDENSRRESIVRQLEEKGAEMGGKPLYPPDLLEDVCFLVEYPVVIAGSFNESYLQIPREVLITTMHVHQRFFPVVSPSTGELLPLFMGVSNNLYSEYTRRGYEKVLEARLADAGFFYREDTACNLEEHVPGLKRVLFQESLGSLYDKSERIKNLTVFLSGNLELSEEVTNRAVRAAYLCKADLITQMVKEFPELQGTMGREYAFLSGEEEQVAWALHEHYLPGFAGDKLPETVEGTLVSVSDRIDTLAGCFMAGIQPTGSQDPYALRRQALGLIQILLEKEISVSLPLLVKEALAGIRKENNIEQTGEAEVEESEKKLLDFLEQRVRYIFQEEKGLPHDVVEAVLAVPYENIVDLYRRALLLNNSLQEQFFQDISVAYTRVNNLARKANESGEVNPSLLEEQAEKELWEAALEKEGQLRTARQNADYKELLLILSSLREPVDKFFDHVMVMVDKDDVRQNRLNLLKRLQGLFNLYADFSLIRGSYE